jgi:hydroxypyruvate reductase
VLPGGHPIPTGDSLRSAQSLAEFLADGRADDLVFCLISGGGSALMTLPQDGVSLEDMQSLTRLLLASGADIGEINTLRKHLDRVKGGGLARLAAPAQLVTLVLSDVIGSPLDVIASGPTVADLSTYGDAYGILEKYHLDAKAHAAVISSLHKGLRGESPETVKPGDSLLERVTNQVIASNTHAAQAALAQAQAEGFNPLLLTTYLQGEAVQAGGVLASILRQVQDTGQPVARPACIVVGGETTVTLRGSGLGGRNQELALGAVRLLAGLPGVALVTLATDGEDGPTDAAGAIVTGDILPRASGLGLELQRAMQENDSYHFFDPTKALLKPGPTGTNVNDLAFLFAF